MMRKGLAAVVVWMGLVFSGQVAASVVVPTGTWVLEGRWDNTTFGTTGGLRLEATINPDLSAGMVLDLDGPVFGGFDPAPVSLDGEIDLSSMTFSAMGGDAVFGPIFTLADLNAGTFGGFLSAIPDLYGPGNDGLATFSGVFDLGTGTLAGNYEIFQPVSGMPPAVFAEGTFTATVVPVPAAFWLMLSGVTAMGAAMRRRRV